MNCFLKTACEDQFGWCSIDRLVQIDNEWLIVIDEELIFGLGLGIIGTERYHLFGQVIVSDRFGLDNHLLFGLGISDSCFAHSYFGL
jgi:hypothetical protein